MKARQNGADAFAAIETVLPWEEFTASVGEANKLSQPEEFDFIHLMAENWPTIRRYAPALLEALHLRAAPAGQAVLESAGGKVLDWHTGEPMSYGKLNRRNGRFIAMRSPYTFEEFTYQQFLQEQL